MKAKDLIELLKNIDPEKEVLTTCDCEGTDAGGYGLFPMYKCRERYYHIWYGPPPSPTGYNIWGDWEECEWTCQDKQRRYEREIVDHNPLRYLLFIRD